MPPRPRASCRGRRGCDRAPPGRRGASRKPPQALQIGAPVLRLAGGSRLFVRAADRPVVAVPAGAAVGHGGAGTPGGRRARDPPAPPPHPPPPAAPPRRPPP